MKRIVMLIAVVFVLFGMSHRAHAYSDPGYPFGYAQCRSNPISDNVYGFYKSHCTSYVAYMLNMYGVSFNNAYLQPSGDTWGNAGLWDSAAGDVVGQNIVVDDHPLPGDVAYWDTLGGTGHVAWVEKVYFNSNGDATSLDITEYNYNECVFGSRNVSVSNPDGFIHILAYNEGVTGLHYLDCYEMGDLCSNQTHQEWGWIVDRVWSNYRCTNCSGNYRSAYINTLADSVGGMGGGGESYGSHTSGSLPDFTPDFDVYHLDGHEISANCNNCQGESVQPGQVVHMRLEVETHNRDVQVGDLRNSSTQSIDGRIKCRVIGKTDWQEIPGSENNLEYDVDNLVTDNNSSVETIDYTIPNYPGSILECQAKVDDDDEVIEENESNNNSRIERFLIESYGWMLLLM